MKAIAVLVFLLFSRMVFGGDGSTFVEPPEPRVVIDGETMDGCSFSYGSVDFCDERHRREISKAIRRGRVNFFRKYILLSMVERVEYQQSSVVVINKENGEFYPLPIDSYSEAKGVTPSGRVLVFNSDDNKICVVGDILVYRSIKSGSFCFFFEGEGFSGYRTEYMK